MAALDDLTTAVADLQGEDSALLTAVNAAFTDLEAEVAALQAAVAAGDTAGIEAAAASIGSVVTDLKGVTTTATADDPGAQSPAGA